MTWATSRNHGRLLPHRIRKRRQVRPPFKFWASFARVRDQLEERLTRNCAAPAAGPWRGTYLVDRLAGERGGPLPTMARSAAWRCRMRTQNSMQPAEQASD